MTAPPHPPPALNSIVGLNICPGQSSCLILTRYDKYGAEWLKSKNAQITHNLLLIWCAAESPWLPRDHPQFPETPRESRHLHPGGQQVWQKAARVLRTLPLQSLLVNPVNPRGPLFPPLPQEKVSWAGAGGVDSMRAGWDFSETIWRFFLQNFVIPATWVSIFFCFMDAFLDIGFL